MNCPIHGEVLMFGAGQTRQHMEQLDAHAHTCPDCQRQLALLRAQWAALAEQDLTPPSGAIERLRAAPAGPPLPWWTRVEPGALRKGIIAVVVVLLIATSTLLGVGPSRAAEAEMLEPLSGQVQAGDPEGWLEAKTLARVQLGSVLVEAHPTSRFRLYTHDGEHRIDLDRGKLTIAAGSRTLLVTREGNLHLDAHAVLEVKASTGRTELEAKRPTVTTQGPKGVHVFTPGQRWSMTGR